MALFRAAHGGTAVGAAMFLAISVAVILGVLVPILFNRAGIDPAGDWTAKGC